MFSKTDYARRSSSMPHSYSAWNTGDVTSQLRTWIRRKMKACWSRLAKSMETACLHHITYMSMELKYLREMRDCPNSPLLWSGWHLSSPFRKSPGPKRDKLWTGKLCSLLWKVATSSDLETTYHHFYGHIWLATSFTIFYCLGKYFKKGKHESWTGLNQNLNFPSTNVRGLVTGAIIHH